MHDRGGGMFWGTSFLSDFDRDLIIFLTCVIWPLPTKAIRDLI